MNYDKIISEEIRRYINENVFDESSSTKSKKNIKKKNPFDKSAERAKRRDGENISKSDENNLRSLFDKGILNVSAVAQKVYPDHTPEGAQSQLRKKLEGEKNDNGSEYHIKQREDNVIRQIINKIK